MVWSDTKYSHPNLPPAFPRSQLSYRWDTSLERKGVIEAKDKAVMAREERDMKSMAVCGGDA